MLVLGWGVRHGTGSGTNPPKSGACTSPTQHLVGGGNAGGSTSAGTYTHAIASDAIHDAMAFCLVATAAVAPGCGRRGNNIVCDLHCDRGGVCQYESGNNISKLGSMFYKIALTNIPISFSIFSIFYRKNTKKYI